MWLVVVYTLALTVCMGACDSASGLRGVSGLNAMVPYYDQALDMILDLDQDEGLSDEQQNAIENEAENLYGLIHARYLLTTRGLQVVVCV
jgi:hypothetical protein